MNCMKIFVGRQVVYHDFTEISKKSAMNQNFIDSNGGFQTASNMHLKCCGNPSRTPIHFLRESCRSRHFLQDSWTDLQDNL